MGKTPKKAAPGGDERNLYNRRLKATTAPSNPSETSLHKRQRESEIPSRSKLTTLQKRIPSGSRKNFKSNIRGPTKFETNRTAKTVGKPSGSSKEDKSTFPQKGEVPHSTKMQPESEEAEVKIDPPMEKEETSKDGSKDTQEPDKEHVDHVFSEPVSISEAQEDDAQGKESVAEDEQTENEEKGNNSNKSKDVEEHEENASSLAFKTEESSLKVQEEKADKDDEADKADKADKVDKNDKDDKDDKDLREECVENCSATVAASKNDVHEKEDLQSESQTDTESYSADVLEFTTSEISEASETASQNDAHKEKETVDESIGKENSFVSYDPSIMLKDVQIKLSDCLKENSKVFDTINSSSNTASQALSDMSFGKTLRSISGRRSLSRMRHVTLREHRYSPDDSMFVNTSGVSLPQDEAADFKILRYSTGLSDTLSAMNGTPTERKRKCETDNWSCAKKPKTESENSLLNSSISLLKGLRRPIQVSTPVSELKFQSGKLNLEEESKPANDEGNRKWCVIM